MKQKIEWYQEVLEIEPNSKIFFPLARMLAKDGRLDEAVSVLRQGAGRHPDHIEARLFLVELLHKADRTVEFQREMETLSTLFKTYPGFWRAWGERLFTDDATRDAGLAAIFLAAFLQNGSISWSGVIERGLKSLMSGEANMPVGERISLAAPVVKPPPFVPETPLEEEEAKPLSVAIDDVIANIDALTSSVSANCKENYADADEDELDEPITLRTHSMADVLAEQGDISGALDIYTELLAESASPDVKKELQLKIDTLAAMSTPGVDADVPPKAHEEKNRLTDMLELLAQRLEAKSLQ